MGDTGGAGSGPGGDAGTGPGRLSMHRHPSGRACADGRVLLEIPVALARAVLAELTRRSLAHAVDNVHGRVTS